MLSPRERATARLTMNSVACAAGWVVFGSLTWGSAALHTPRLRCHQLRGLSNDGPITATRNQPVSRKERCSGT
jgi:hypothetical protein